MRRVENWPRYLAEYIDNNRDTPFEWGLNDCVTFANGACVAQTGQGFFAEWGGEACSVKDIVREFNARMDAGDYEGPLDIIDIRLPRGNGFPPRGSIIARKVDGPIGFGLGVVLGNRAAFAGVNGVVFDAVSPNDAWWIV